MRPRVPISLILLIVLAPLAVIPGCGGCDNHKGGGGGPQQITTGSVRGAVTVSDVSNLPLQVRSAWLDTAQVQNDGSFVTTVSTEGAQLLLATDTNGNVRALAISVPGAGGAPPAQLHLDAESTAQAMIFATPGIMASEPEVAAQRLQQIHALSSFAALVDLLRQKLPDDPLLSVAQDEEFVTLSQKCVDEWFLLTEPVSTRAVIPGPYKGDFFVEVRDEHNLSAVQVQLINHAWRYVNVFRRELDASGNEVRVVTVADGVNSMPGARPASWGSLFTWSIGDPTEKSDQFSLAASGAAKVEYWIRGPGWVQGETSVPSSLPGSTLDAWGMTAFRYLVLPMVDLLVGGSRAVTEADDIVKACWSGIKGVIDSSKLSALEEASDTREGVSAMIDVSVDLLKVSLATGALVSAGVISPEAAAALGIVVGLGTTVFSAANVGICARFFATYPRTAVIPVQDVPSPISIVYPGSRLRASAFATGSISGHVADVQLENLTSNRVTGIVSPGTSFQNTDSDRQGLTVIKEVRVRLDVGETYTAEVQGVCISLHKSPPQQGNELTPYDEQRSDLVALCKAIQDLGTDPSVANQAVWVITDDEEPSSSSLASVIDLFVAAQLQPGRYPALRQAIAQ